MADELQFDSGSDQIGKDVQKSNNAVPLLPQWLLPKTGDNKTAMVTEDNSPSLFPGYTGHQDPPKFSVKGFDGNENEKKDVSRPSVLDTKAVRWDRWRDEERGTNFSIRKDQWRDAEREYSDTRKVVRKGDTSVRHYGETRRAPGERWSDSGNRDNHDQRRESKWNTRWGRDEKETTGAHEKWGEVTKEEDVFHDKTYHLPYHGKDEREGEHNRPWRSNSLYGRGRSDANNPISTPSKHVPTPPNVIGRGENPSPRFSIGRGRLSSGDSSATLPFMKLPTHKGESDNGAPYPFTYSRAKLIDVFRAADVLSHKKFQQSAVQVPPITLETPVEPLALCEPTPQELDIFTGIDRGEISGSGAPKINKPVVQRHGTTDELPSSLDDANDEAWDHPDGFSHEKASYGWSSSKLESQPSSDHKMNVEALREENAVPMRNDHVPVGREFASSGNSSFLRIASGNSSSFRERSHPVPVPRVPSIDAHRSSNSAWESNVIDFSNTRTGETKWSLGGSPVMRMQASASLGRERDQPKLSYPSPEDMVLFYKDPQGDIQGPFPGSDMITWFESGYFGLDLQVRLASASVDAPFSALADVMPHLKLRARPPPGFSPTKPNEIPDLSGRLNHSTSGKFHSVESGAHVLNDLGYKHISSTESENRFLESLMVSNLSAAPPIERLHSSEGMQGYGGKNSFPMPSLDPVMERQKSLQNSYPIWPSRDAAPLSLSSEITNETSPAQLKLLSSNTDNVQSQLPHNMESMTLHQLADRSAAIANSGISGRVPFPTQGGLDPLLDKLDVPQSHNFPPQSAVVMQQQRLHSQNPAANPLLTHLVDNSAGVLTPENLLASGIPHDPQVLSLLQQQYLLQLQSYVPVQSQQLSFLEKLLLLKQQQKQEELQLMRHQQQLLSQLITEQQNNQLHGETSFTQLSGGFPAGIPTSDHNDAQNQHDLSQICSQSQASKTWNDEANAAKVFPPGPRDVNVNAGLEPMVHLPHQIQTNRELQGAWSAALPVNIDEEKSSALGESVDLSLTSDVKNKCMLDSTLHYESAQVENSDIGTSLHAGGNFTELSVPQETSPDDETVFHQVVDASETALRTFEEQKAAEEYQVNESLLVKEIKNSQAQEGKKSSDKKSKKQKSKISLDTAKGINKANITKTSEVQAARYGDGKSESLVSQEDLLAPSFSENRKTENALDHVDFQAVQKPLLAHDHADTGMAIEAETVAKQTQMQVGRTAWKHASDFRPKSLLEIQEEEQRRARLEIRLPEISASASSTSAPGPWAGVVNPDRRPSNEIEQHVSGSKLNLAKSDSSSALLNKKSQEEDLFWYSGTSKTGDRALERFPSSVSSQADSSVENDFIETKDTKKGRKKSSRAKNAVSKASSAGVDMSVGSSPVDKGKYTLQMQQQNEVPLAVPSGPSLGDFVLWKGESASPPAPAWSTHPVKAQKPASLRDILKEQEKKTFSPLPVPTPKPAINPPRKAASPVQKNLASGSSLKQKADVDLFWEPSDQPHREDKKSDFPQLGAPVNLGGKSSAPKVTRGGPPNQKKFAEPSFSSSVSSQIPQAGKTKSSNKHSEAMDFKRWCESECIRLIGSEDTSILEYCLKISRPEAETLLIENLASVDPNHEFIDKFLNYKDFLPADAVDIAFKNRNDQKNPTVAALVEDMTSDQVDASEWDANTKGGGKKKGKKGKKVSSSSILGFSVVSNRIMMGEIQTVDD